MKRRICLVLLAYLNCASQPISAQSDRWSITAANYERVRIGMTIEEVKNLLGAPFDILTAPTAAVLDEHREKLETWIYQHHEVLVTIGFRNGYVINKCWTSESPVVATENKQP